MLRFFRSIRQRLLTENRFSKFFLYVIVEILIVIIGILIAIEVDDWNQESSQKERFHFGIEKVFDRILADYYYWDTYKDRAEYQFHVIDSLLMMPDSIHPNRILGNLLILDELIRDWYTDEEYYLDYFKFYPTDSFQFEILERLRLYFYGSWEGVRRLYVTKEDEGFRKLLLEEDLPICDKVWGKSFNYFIEECSTSNFLSEYRTDLTGLISSKKVRSKLHLLKERCKGIQATKFMPGSEVLETLEASFDFLDRDIKTMEIIGSAILTENWEKGIDMHAVSDQPATWERELTLQDGVIRFRTQDGNDYSWGGGEMDKNKLTFGGHNIPVRGGQYHVVVDLSNGTYYMKPL